MNWRIFRFRRRSENSSSSPNSSVSLPAKSDHNETFESICAWIVVLGVVLEYVPKFRVLIGQPSIEALKDTTGGILIALGIAGEIIFGHRADRKKDLMVADLRTLAETEQRKRREIELKLFTTLGPRRIDPAQIDRMSDLFRHVLPDARVLVFVCPQANREPQKEVLDFAFQLSAVFGRAPVCSRNSLDWDLPDDLTVIPSRTGIDEVRNGTARAVFGILELEKFVVHGPIPLFLSHDFVFQYGPSVGGGFLVAANNITSEVLEQSVWIVVGKRSQPVFRLED